MSLQQTPLDVQVRDVGLTDVTKKVLQFSGKYDSTYLLITRRGQDAMYNMPGGTQVVKATAVRPDLSWLVAFFY
ncbi:MAG: hypothetical protein E3K32_11890 [wastewater metagenome]|nr:hypothetical protein [Candidatus Loosdrechtia aerotolerans]